ncbi:MAG: SpoIIE family protein phosphatase [Crocinitomicaceae bacterium]|nr:SpoIIE family protein phosphatase [Crocinitomicaceae bacterium]
MIVLISCNKQEVIDLDENKDPNVDLALEKGYEINQFSGLPVNLIISPKGDTVPTGIPYKIVPTLLSNDSIKAPTILKAGEGEKNINEFRLYYYPEKIDTTSVLLDSIVKIPLGQGNSEFIKVTSYGDTIQTGIPLILEPKVFESKAPVVIKAMPPYYMENCYSDIQSIDVAQGLKSAYINDFHEDANGNLWFVTAGEGLGKYDGLHFYFYSIEQGLTTGEVRQITSDTEGSLWMYSDDGLIKFDGQKFYQYSEEEGFFDDQGNFIERDSSGNIWAGTNNGGLAKYDGEYFTFYTPKEGLLSSAVQGISIAPDGSLWFCGRGLTRFDGSEFTYYLPKCGVSRPTVTSMFCASDGRVWYATSDGLIECLDNDKIIKYGKLDNLPLTSSLFKKLYEDSKGNLWIGTDIGACVFDGEKIQRFTTQEGQHWRSISSIHEDKSGNIWLGTYGSGMHRFKENSFSMLTQYHGLIEDVNFAISGDHEGNIWFGSRERGVGKFDGKTFTNYTEKDGLAGDRVRWIMEDSKNNIWFGTNHDGVSKFDGDFFTNYNEESGLSHDIVKCIFEDKNGEIWFATFNGLTRFDGQNFYQYTSKEGFPVQQIWSIEQDEKGNLWFASNNSGLVKYDGNSFITYTEKEGLSTNQLRSLLVDDYGNLWIGTNDKGVVRFDGEQFEYVSEAQGLCNNKVMSVIKDDQNNIWVGTDHGLSVIENEQKDPERRNIRNFSYVDGLKALDFNTTSAYHDNENRMWLATGKGVTVIKADYVNFQYNKPQIQLNYLNIDDEYLNYRNDRVKLKYKVEYDSVASFYNYPINPTFDHTLQHISFHFSAVDWSAPHRIQYSYKLEGLYDNWSNPTPDDRVDFRNLAPGNYVFKVKAKGDRGDWCEPFVYPFTISTPWWQTNVAYALYLVAFILLVFLIIRWRTHNLSVKKELLEKRVEFATQQLREQFHELQDKNKEIAEQKEEVEKQKEIIEHNHQQIKDSIQYSQKIQHSLLLSADGIRMNYNNFFLLFEPKDIVSGDFYFFRQFGDVDYISCVDCTGHGVPGGFMSTLSYLLMDKIIQDDSKSPGEIMTELSEELIATLHQQDPDSIQDGMDMSLCKIDRKRRTVEFAGARNGMLIADSNQIKHYSPDYLPVGGNYIKNGKPIERNFQTQTFNIEEGSWVILYTDGYVEQLGGKDGLPMRSREYESLIHQAIQLDDHNKIKAFLSEELEKWQGDQERIDDICLIGFRL